jgi:LPXTG-motif cell wall-anchored protein
MRRILTILSAACGTLVVTSTLAGAQINSDRLTYVTFSAPVAIPGATLPAGTYAFKLLDSLANRNVVQVFDKEQTRLFATVMAIAAQRNEPADETVITFREAPSNAPPAIRFWYYPGEKAGQEFAYPKSQAMLIANAAREPVLAVEAESGDVDAMKGGAITRVEPGAATASTPAAEPAAAAQPTPSSPTTPAQSTPPAAATTTAPALTEPARPADVTTPEPAPVGTSGTSRATSTRAAEEQPPGSPGAPAAPATTASPAQLPQTASQVPLLAFAGLLALGGAVSVRMLRRAKA